MSNIKSMRKLAIILVVIAVATFSVAYAASTGQFTITGENQTVTNPSPDIYFVNGYEGPPSFSSDYSPPTSVPGTATLSGDKYSGETVPDGQDQKTGRTVTITGSNFDCSAGEASVAWTLPVKNFGTSNAVKNNFTLKATVNSIEYNFYDSGTDNVWKSEDTSLEGLTFVVEIPDTVAGNSSNQVILTSKVGTTGLTVSGAVQNSFTYNITLDYNAQGGQQTP